MRGCPEGFPPGYHRDTLRRRYILCGTFRDGVIADRRPLVTRRAALLCFRKVVSGLSSREPCSAFRWTQDKPAIVQLTRHPYYTL